MALTYLPKAEACGAQILANTEAEVFEREGARVTSIMAVQRDLNNGHSEKKVRVRARLFVVAGGGIRTPPTQSQTLSLNESWVTVGAGIIT